MENRKLDILLEHLDLNCKYYVEDGGGLCERAWADTDREALEWVCCEGHISKCELTTNHVIRYPEKEGD